MRVFHHQLDMLLLLLLALATAAAGGETKQNGRSLVASDYARLNQMLAPVSVTLPPIEASSAGIAARVSNLTCHGVQVEDISLSVVQVDAITYDISPRIAGLSIECTAHWSYSIASQSGHGVMTVRAVGATMAAVLHVRPEDYALVAGASSQPSPPPAAFHATSCQAASSCNSPCGVTPGEFSAAVLDTALPTQCYFCDKYYWSEPPAWCTYTTSGVFSGDICCTLHDCVGPSCGAGSMATSPPPSTAPCAAAPKCSSACGANPPSLFFDDADLGLPAYISSSQCYECLSDTDEGWCQFRDDGGKCCKLHSCTGRCPAPPPPAPPPLPCTAASGCTSACGETPAAYSAARIPQAGLDQCYYCGTWCVPTLPRPSSATAHKV